MKKLHFSTEIIILSATLLLISLPPISTQSVLKAGIFGDGEFCYTETSCGPESSLWGGQCQTGSRQTPISLPLYPSPNPQEGLTLYLNSFRTKEFKMRNNKHSVVIEFLDAQKPLGFRRYHDYFQQTDYVLNQTHFHWGSNDSQGSEHEFEGGQRYSMEMHMVHHKKNYANLGAALMADDPTALAVLGIMFDASSTQSNPELAPIVENLQSVQSYSDGSQTVQKELDFTSFLPIGAQNQLHTYMGSLTTPPCAEKVVWYVYSRPTPVSSEDVQQFRLLQDGQGEPITENHRPIQPRKGRTVSLVSASFM